MKALGEVIRFSLIGCWYRGAPRAPQSFCRHRLRQSSPTSRAAPRAASQITLHGKTGARRPVTDAKGEMHAASPRSAPAPADLSGRAHRLPGRW